MIAAEFPLSTETLVSTYLQEFQDIISTQRSRQDIPCLSLCHSILDLMYEGGRFRGLLNKGGKLQAAAILATAYAIGANSADLGKPPFLAVLSSVSGKKTHEALPYQ